MKDLLSKKAYCYKIYILQINSGAYPPPHLYPLYGLLPPICQKKFLILPFLWFFKSLISLKFPL